ncbi:MAG: hypothetical protein WCJ39_05105 [bacterium]
MKEEKDLDSLRELVFQKKKEIMQNDGDTLQGFRCLKDETMKAVLSEYDFHSKSKQANDHEVKEERNKLINKINSLFSGPEMLLSFTSSFQNLQFGFSHEVAFKWGPGLDHTKICKVTMGENWNTIGFHSYSYFPSYW